MYVISPACNRSFYDYYGLSMTIILQRTKKVGAPTLFSANQ